MSLFRSGRSAEGGRPRIPVRLILAAVIALIGVVSYMARTEVNPVTGEKQHIALSVDEEKALGLQSAPEMAAQMGGVVDPRSDPRAAMVEEVGRRIVERSEASKSPYVGNFQFYLLDDPETINAFALPGGPIFITRALYEKLDTEAQLAGVLGHEIGHVINRHAAERIAKTQLGQSLVAAVGVGATDDQGDGRQAAMAAAVANQMIQMRYGRGDESESDAYGLAYMAQAGYDPEGMLRVMEVLREANQSGGGQPEFLSTHPLPETRLDELHAWLDEHRAEIDPSQVSQGRRLPQAGGGYDGR